MRRVIVSEACRNITGICYLRYKSPKALLFGPCAWNGADRKKWARVSISENHETESQNVVNILFLSLYYQSVSNIWSDCMFLNTTHFRVYFVLVSFPAVINEDLIGGMFFQRPPDSLRKALQEDSKQRELN